MFELKLIKGLAVKMLSEFNNRQIK
jgi:hypothetical protein